MEYDEYKAIYNRLNRPEDVRKMMDEGYDSRLVKTLYVQKTSRDVKKRFHVVKNHTRQMLKDWKSGHSLMEISEKWKFPPILTSMFIFQEDGASKKEFWSYIRNPDSLNRRTAEEIKEVVANDYVYSPDANEDQRLRGIWGEDLLHKWLDGQGITYRTENDIRGEYQKTPDALLDEPMMFNGHKIYWVESKASFGDNVEFRFNSRKQLIPYTEIFGPGIVIYWVGCLKDMECPKGIFLEDYDILEKNLKPCPKE